MPINHPNPAHAWPLNAAHVGEMVRFGIVGVLNVVISFAAYYLTYNYWGISSSFADSALEAMHAFGIVSQIDDIQGINSAFANVIAYITGMMNSFVLNKTWTFRTKDGTSRELLRFVVINIFSLVLSTTAMFALVDAAGLPYILTWFAVIIPITILSFLANKFWAFAGARGASATARLGE